MSFVSCVYFSHQIFWIKTYIFWKYSMVLKINYLLQTEHVLKNVYLWIILPFYFIWLKFRKLCNTVLFEIGNLFQTENSKIWNNNIYNTKSELRFFNSFLFFMLFNISVCSLHLLFCRWLFDLIEPHTLYFFWFFYSLLISCFPCCLTSAYVLFF